VSGAADFTGGTSVNGQAATTTANASFTVDGNAVTLTTDYTNLAGVVSEIQNGVYSVTSSSGGVLISKIATGSGSTAPAIAGADAALITAGGTPTAGQAAGSTTNTTSTSTGVNAAVTAVGSTPLTLAAGAFTVQVGTGTAVDLAGSYADGQALADTINSSVAGAYASFDTTTNQLALSSGQAVTLGGTRFGTGNNNLGFAASSVTANSGSLAVASVTSAANANTTILRIDAALTSVNSLRGGLGAIQNRFESTITNLTTASENLTASRSRIQDADFAAETASLTRAQILQQAGTAILAQANAVPQNVLSLLR
jgi:flagellin